MPDISFQGVNRHFVWSLENSTHQTSYKNYFLPTVELKDYIIRIDRQNFFDQTVKTNLRTYSIWKIAAGQGDVYTTGCLL